MKKGIDGFGHIAINTLDVQESIRFYREVMGMEVVSETDMGDFTLYGMGVNADEFVELFDWRGKMAYDPAQEIPTQFKHMAFRVTGIEDWYEHLKKHNVKFQLELKALKMLGVWAIMFEDPNGAVIELNQPLKEEEK